jgi:hypothetical protein
MGGEDEKGCKKGGEGGGGRGREGEKRRVRGKES